jgi:hypothetical protein
MRKLTLALITLITLSASAQTEKTQSLGTKTNSIEVLGGLYADSGFYMPYRAISWTPYRAGAIQLHTGNKLPYYWDGTMWLPFVDTLKLTTRYTVDSLKGDYIRNQYAIREVKKAKFDSANVKTLRIGDSLGVGIKLTNSPLGWASTNGSGNLFMVADGYASNGTLPANKPYISFSFGSSGGSGTARGIGVAMVDTLGVAAWQWNPQYLQNSSNARWAGQVFTPDVTRAGLNWGYGNGVIINTAGTNVYDFNTPGTSILNDSTIKLPNIKTYSSGGNKAVVWNSITKRLELANSSSSEIPADFSLSAIGSSPNANGASYSSTTGLFNLQPASRSFGGVITTGSQPFQGQKRWFSSTDTIATWYIDTTVRSILYANGIQSWKLNNGATESGYIGYSTPIGTPGIIFNNAAGTGRSQIRQYVDTGGIAIGSESGSGVIPGNSLVVLNNGHTFVTGFSGSTQGPPLVTDRGALLQVGDPVISLGDVSRLSFAAQDILYTSNRNSINTGIWSFVGSNDVSGYPFYSGRRGRGTMSAPSAVLIGDTLGKVGFGVFDGSVWQPFNSASFNVISDGNASPGSTPTKFTLGTTPAGSETQQTRFEIGSNGQLKANAYGIGTFTGTAAKWAAFTSSGNVIEVDPPSAASETMNAVADIPALLAYSGTATTLAVKDATRGGIFNIYPSATTGYTADNGLVFHLSDGRWAVRDISQMSMLHVEWFDVTGSGSDETTNFQAAINAAQTLKYGLALQRKTYVANIQITGQLYLEGNGAGITPATNTATIYIRHGSVPLIIKNLTCAQSTVSRAWTQADGIYIDGNGSSEDYITIDNVQFTGCAGYGLYAVGNSTSNGFVQRLHVTNSKFVQCQYAGLRAEGVCLEWQIIGCFFNQSGQGGALPVTSDQLTHPASPSREFRRGAVELLRWYDADNSANNSLTPNRINFIGDNFIPYDTTVANRQIASVYVSAGNSVVIQGSNFELSHPAVWAAREDGVGDGNYATSANSLLLIGNTIRINSGDIANPQPMVLNDGFRNMVMENNIIRGVGTPTVYAVVLNRWDGTGANYFGPFDYKRNNRVTGISIKDTSAYNGGHYVKYLANTYAATSSISGTTSKYAVSMQGSRMRVVSSSGGQGIDAISTDSNIFDVMDGTTVTLEAYKTSTRSVILHHNSDDGNGGGVKLKGRLLLSDAADETMSSDDQSVVLEYHESDSAWHEVGKNFQGIPVNKHYALLSDLDATTLYGGTYYIKQGTTAGTYPSGFGATATGTLLVLTSAADNKWIASTAGVNQTQILWQNNSNTGWYRNYSGSSGTYSSWVQFNSGASTVGTFSNTATANGLDITSGVITLHAADASNPGALSTGTQTLPGTYTLQNTLTSRAIVPSASNTYDLGSNASLYATAYINNIRGGSTATAFTFKQATSERARFAATTGNLLIGTTTDDGVTGHLLQVAGSITGTANIISGTNGNGYIELNSQSPSVPAAPTSAGNIRLYATGGGDLSWKNQNDGFSRKLAATLTADRVYTFPDADITVVGTSATQSLTNKTINANLNTVSNITNSNLSGSAGITYANLQQVSAHKMLVNNTASAATVAEDNFNHPGMQTYTGTITWDGTAPSGTTTHTYNWIQVGNMVTLNISLIYGTAGTTNTNVTMSLPADCPAPVQPTGASTASGGKWFPGYGYIDASTTGNPGNCRVSLQSDGAGGWKVAVIGASQSAKTAQVTVQYFIN